MKRWLISATILTFNLLSLAFLIGLATGSTAVEMGSQGRPANFAHSNREPVKVSPAISGNPLAFTANMGQWPDSILFRACRGGATMWFTPTGVYYQLFKQAQRDSSAVLPRTPVKSMGNPVVEFPAAPDKFEMVLIMANFVGANLTPEVAGTDKMDYKCNFFFGNDPASWRTDVHSYSSIVYNDIYPGIDLNYYGNGNQMEYDFKVAPGADYSRIQLHYKGAKALSVNDAGELVIETEYGSIIERRPVIYQIESGMQRPLQGGYILHEGNRFSFELEGTYNPQLPLVIDPVLVYSTYLGGSGTDRGVDIAVDTAGNAYVAGYTVSANFPTINPYDGSLNYASINDVFVTKLSANGTSLIYSTYLGGYADDYAYGVAVDIAGCAYLTGVTGASNFPTANAYDASLGGTDAFVTKLSAGGNSLIYSTYLGGSSYDGAHGIAVDNAGNAYVTGETFSSDFPTVNFYDGNLNSYSDCFVTKVGAAGNSLIYSTYLGGNDVEAGTGIAVDTVGNGYVIGRVSSTDFPTVNAFDVSMDGMVDVFVAKLNPSGNSLVFSTYLGGSNSETCGDIAVDVAGNAYVTGQTWSSDFPTANPYDASPNSYIDIFVTKFSVDGSNLAYSTYLGGSGNEESGIGIAVDQLGQASVTGFTNSADFPMANPFDGGFAGFRDAIVTKLSADGTGLIYSTFLGGIGNENDGYDGGGTVDNAGTSGSIAVDNEGNVYVTGYTNSTDFPTANPYDGNFNGQWDAYVTKLGNGLGYLCGDASGNGVVNILDVTFLIDYLYKGGPAPDPVQAGDVNKSGSVNVLDVAYLISYLYKGGPGPNCP